MAAVVLPDLMIKLPLVFVKDPNCVLLSFKNISPPLASKLRSPSISNVKSPDATSISLPPFTRVRLSTVKPAAAVTAPVNVDAPVTSNVPVALAPAATVSRRFVLL